MTTLMVACFAAVFFAGFFALVGAMMLFLWSVDLFLRLLSRKSTLKMPALPNLQASRLSHSL